MIEPVAATCNALILMQDTRGLEADQKVIAAHRCYAMTATTALTAQNTLGVYGIHKTPPEFVKKQIDACVSDIGVDVVKTGKLHQICHYIVQSLIKYKKECWRRKQQLKLLQMPYVNIKFSFQLWIQ